MKKLILYSFISLFLISSCRESDNIKVPEFIEVPMPTVKKVSGDLTISTQNPDAFTAKYSVGLYFADGDKPAKMDVVIRKNVDNSTAKLLQADVTTYPTELTITGTQLKTLYGTIALGDRFDIGVDITLANGKKYLAFPTVGVPYGSGVASPAGSSTSARYEAVCAFKMSDFGAIGTSVAFTVLEDKWADYAVGETIQVEIIDETHMSFKYPATNAQPIVITINPVGNIASVLNPTNTAYGSYAGDAFAARTQTTNAVNIVAPCQLTVTVALLHKLLPNGPDYGPYTISLKKK